MIPVLAVLCSLFHAWGPDYNEKSVSARHRDLSFGPASWGVHWVSFQVSPRARVMTNVTSSGKGQDIVTIRIYKDELRGFARFSDLLPTGCTARPVDIDGGSFSVSEGKVLVVWANIQMRDSIIFSYALSTPTKREAIFAGEFTYLEQNQTRKVHADPLQIVIGAGTGNTEKKLAKAEESKTKSPKRSTEKKPAVESRPQSEVAKHAAKHAKGEVEFRVQVGAFKRRRITAKRLMKRFKLTEQPIKERADGYTKFMVGSYVELAAARDRRDQLKTENGIRTAFIVAYIGGKRVTIHEALEKNKQDKQQ